MIEHFSGRIAVALQSHDFRSGAASETKRQCHVRLSNQPPSQSALGSKTPLQAMKHRRNLNPDPLRTQPYHLTRGDSRQKSWRQRRY